jgi:hypothetical protein
MNIKQFLIIKICNNFPSDVLDLIWKEVMKSAADTIRNIYLLKVARNIDIFLNVLKFSNYNDSYSDNYVENYLKYNCKKITYKYIQEPGTWIGNLLDIKMNKFMDTIPSNSECINTIIINITMNNVVYENTGIAYWNNL